MEKKVALITGASSGIGKAISEKLINAGCSVLLNSRNCGKVFQQTENLKINCDDLTEPKTPKGLLDNVLSSFGKCDYLFINAGTIESGKIEDIDIEKVCSMVRLKVEASFRLIYTFLKYFKSVDCGHIFITSSVLGSKTREESGAYAGCNFALEALAESLRMELSDTNIQITCIEPGLVQTNLHKNWPVHPKDLLGISSTLLPSDIADSIYEIMQKPDHIRIPKYMILPKGHRI